MPSVQDPVRPKDLPLFAQLRLLFGSRVFGLANLMEVLERLAYYGLRVVLPIYMVLAVERGGPEFDHLQKGLVYGWWAFVQSMVPVMSGGFADRYGYKKTVAVSILLKVMGYLVMGWCVELGALASGGASEAQPGHPAVLAVFMTGALLLAAGTGIFKPGLQSLIALSMPEGTKVTGWAVFYQLVNVGGFFGPFLAGAMRLLAWRYVFVSCAAIVSLNYLVLLTFREPARTGTGFGRAHPLSVLWQSLVGMFQPRLFSFIVLFSGYWLMFFQLFDILPNFIDDWVDSRGPLEAVARPVIEAFGGTVPEEWRGRLPQEHMINLNAGVCMTLAFLAGYLTSRIRAVTAMVIGIGLSCVAIWALGFSMNGWVTLLAIAGFSFGEITASPRKAEYLSSLAPSGREGLYLGYVNATQAIGWSLGSVLAGKLYQAGGDKTVLARRMLVERFGHDPTVVEKIPKTEVLPALEALMKIDETQLTQTLWHTYSPNSMWGVFALVGVSSMIGLMVYGRLVERLGPRREWVFMVMTVIYTWLIHDGATLRSPPKYALLFGAGMGLYLWIAKVRPNWLPEGARRSG